MDIAYAQQNLFSVLGIFDALIRSLFPVALTLALLFLFWGLAKFILSSGDEKAHEAGKNILLWGVVTMFVLVSIWGIITFFSDSFGISRGGVCPPPSIGASGVSSGCLK